MKTPRLFRTALVIVLACVSLSSCSNAKEQEAEKKLMEIELKYPHGIETWKCQYDDKGRLASAERTFIPTEDGEKQTSTIRYTWEDGSIRQDGTEVNAIYTLTDGLITNIETSKGDEREKVVLTYNSSKQLATTENETNGKPFFAEAFTWEDGKLKVHAYESKQIKERTATSTLSYENQTCKGFFPARLPSISRNMDEGPLGMVHPELFGIKQTQLPVKYVTEHESGHHVDVSYTLTEDGYIESCTLYRSGILNGKEMKQVLVFTFKWK